MTTPKKALEPRKNPRQQRSRRTRERILAAAARVFAEHGYAAGTTDRIAEQAHLSIGSLYQYFGNKDAILLALAQEHLAESERVIDQALDADATLEDWLTALAEAVHTLHARNPRLHRVIFDEAPRPPDLLDRFHRVEMRAIERVAERLRTDPTVTVDDPELAARIVTATIESLTHRFVGHGRPEQMRRLIDEVVVMLTSYLATVSRPRRRSPGGRHGR
ncbi:TetR family transcriptional regulator [Propionibacteriaceae bacterium ES.041]|uniref:TetR/AcrR family transcriptional regulator n=1 Tax=Enemella evansiae TaxID=2016499 RepID=UPI000B95FFB1|nr:TetR/AcrR family transcriptional regulator [Enemella evansiae]OYN94142.1 TetR family transcriptional regulator [Enemella evansiae]PFG68707.1 TetR family transcriptional regulator [Propionibacteriaceae bacterium ES.041]